MIKGKISFLDVTAYLTDLSKECNESVSKEFERYGIEITNLCIETISPPPSDYESLKRMKEKYALGEHIYTQERKLDLLDKLADNPSNPAISMGAGLGVGLSAAKEMVGSFREVLSDENTTPAQNVQRGSNTAICPQCSSSVPIGQKFCGECGAKMEKKCSSCGKIWDVSQKFCGECGTKL